MKNLIALSMVFGCAAFASATLVVNGDFEASPAATSYTVAGQGLLGWTVEGPSATDQVWVSPNGYLGQISQRLDLTGYSDRKNQGVSQMLATPVGWLVTVSFDVYTGGSTHPGGVDFYVDGILMAGNLQGNEAIVTGIPGALNYTYNFIASGATEIKFLSSTNGTVNQIDNVVATAVPEPGTMAALAAGAFALVRRRNKKA